MNELKGRKNCFWDFSIVSVLQKCDHVNTVVYTAQHTHFYTFIQYYVLGMPPKSSLTEISLRYLGVFLNSNSGFNFYVRTLIIIILHSQDLLSRNVLSNVPVPKAVSSHTAMNRWSDSIGPDRDNRVGQKSW